MKTNSSTKVFFCFLKEQTTFKEKRVPRVWLKKVVYTFGDSVDTWGIHKDSFREKSNRINRLPFL